MDSYTGVERELTLEQAERRILADLANLGLEPQARQLGQRVVAVQVCASSDDAQVVARGSGKGYPSHARVGALFETLEHHLSEQLSSEDIRCIPSRYFSNNPLFIDDTVLATVTEQTDALVACRTYTDLCDHTSFYYPVALSTPRYCNSPLEQDSTDYKALRRYASNSGTAIGANYNEAVLHAVNECIERDALALFLLDHFYYQNHCALRRVVRPEPGDELSQLWLDAEAEIGAPVVLLDISSEFLARTFLAFSTEPGTHPRTFGSGCSLIPRHGAWRALTELVQMHHAMAQPEQQCDLSNAQRHLSPFPRLLRCLQLDLYPLLSQCTQMPVVLAPVSTESPLDEQLDDLAADLKRFGRTLGVSLLHRTPLGTTVVNVVIPGLERFYVVCSGNVVVPQARGRRLHKSRGVPA